MNTDNGEYLDRLLNFDALSQAEDMTGEDYHVSETTSALGMLMHIENGKRKRELLKSMNDTHYSIDFLDAVQIALDLGFEPVYAQYKERLKERSYHQDDEYRSAHYNAYWRDGILLILESYGPTLNTGSIYFNYRNADGSTRWPDWDLGLSGGWSRMTPGFDGELEDDPWTLTVSMNIVEGFRRKLARLEAAPGFILDEWYIRPHMYLVSYTEEPEEGETDWKALTAEKINGFAEPVRSMILETPER